MAKEEAQIERYVCAYVLKNYDVQNIKILAKGFPDRLFFLENGAVIFIEFKAEKGKLSAMQQHIYDFLKKAGYNVQVHKTKKGAIDAIREAKNMASREISDKS